MSSNRPGNPVNVRHMPFVVLTWVVLLGQPAMGQSDRLSGWDIPDSLHAGRFRAAALVGGAAYAGTLIGLHQLWYRQHPRSSFHTFDDRREWMQMDKAGHAFSAYFESDWGYGLARWTGMKPKPAIWAGLGTSMLIQTTIEVLDGYRAPWGFSWYDIAGNVAGASLWGVQQGVWGEQRIRLKVSAHSRRYPATRIDGIPDGETTLRRRAEDLYGRTIFQTFLKDYNAQTIWLSANVASFLQEGNRFPGWINVAIGFGADNMYGGFRNQWEEDGITYSLPDPEYRRYRQWYISPDLDLSRIRVKSKALQIGLKMLNILKIPAPAIVLNQGRGASVRWIYF